MDKETILAIALKRYRQDHGLTQAELAEQLDVSDKTISKWENGETYRNKRNMMRISETIDVPLEVMLVEENEEASQKLKKLTVALLVYIIVFIILGLLSGFQPIVVSVIPVVIGLLCYYLTVKKII
ncbi:XRE family transcriptional regulator [Streptococcus agalactiae LMG 14747]|uniref:XRE family transcriptional regulator n=2 Tax=Streptococcus TaxID=1301 RepID=V6Z0H1_STRAG|nr:helix-turn-helix transcriptional regulator [Streptococcus hyovaginalis]ESV54342.1 XRE family transcriptional regulator [Streptococcus agalactiae LMG 14747]